MNVRHLLPLVAGAALLAVPCVASADPYHSFGGEYERIGRVVAFQPYNLQLDRGPHIFLHKGTVILPTGLTLRNGMPVRVVGHDNPDGSFSADEIDLLPRGRFQELRPF